LNSILLLANQIYVKVHNVEKVQNQTASSLSTPLASPVNESRGNATKDEDAEIEARQEPAKVSWN
jgi:hypothetical protein